MHPALLYLRNALIGALFGIACATTGRLLYMLYVYVFSPGNPFPGSVSGVSMAAAFGQGAIPIGAAYGLAVTYHTRRCAQPDSAPPVLPVPNEAQEDVWPPPPRLPGS